MRQYVGRLLRERIRVEEFPARLGAYPPGSRWIRPAWGMATLTARLPGIARSHGYDLTLLEREFVSTFVTFERLTKRPRVLDVDDAIWMHRGGEFARRLAEACEGVICGNSFLAEKFSCWNQNVRVIPTGVDTERFAPNGRTEEAVIGWSGTSGGFKYLYKIEEALLAALEKAPGSRLRIVSDRRPVLQRIPAERVEFIPWEEGNEVKTVQGMAVGIMPLEDTDWERGKCSFKMLTYMACGIPVVVSPVGMNVEVLSQGEAGIGVRTRDEWVDALGCLLRNPEQREEMGKAGRRVVEEKYSVDAIAPALADMLRKCAEAR